MRTIKPMRLSIAMANIGGGAWEVTSDFTLVVLLGVLLVVVLLFIPIVLAIVMKPRRRMARDSVQKTSPPHSSAWEESGRRFETEKDDEHMGDYG